MNDQEHNPFLHIIRRRIVVIIIGIVLLVSTVCLGLIYTVQVSKNQVVITRAIDEQKMLVESVVENANGKYLALQTLDDGQTPQPSQTIKLKQFDDAMRSAQAQFMHEMQSLKLGQLQYEEKTVDISRRVVNMNPIIQRAENQLMEFNQAIEIVLQSKKGDLSVSNGTMNINQQHEELLASYHEISETLRMMSERSFRMIVVLIICLLLFIIVVFAVSIYRLNKYIIVPLNEVFKRISHPTLLVDQIQQPEVDDTGELKPIVTQIDDAFRKLSKLVELIQTINQDISFEGVLEYIYDSFSEFIPYYHIGVALLKEDGAVLEASYGISDPRLKHLAKRLVGIRSRVDETTLGNILANGTPRVINNLKAYTKDSQARYNRILLEEGIQSSITLPLKINNKAIGLIFFSSIKPNAYKQEHIAFLETLSNSIAISFNKNIFIDELLYSSVLALVKVAEARDEETGDHLERMKQYSTLVAEFLFDNGGYADQVSLGFIREIERFSPMHDIGKVGIRDHVLLKPGKLTTEEFEEMKKHTVYGVEILKAAEENIAKQNRSLFQIGIEIAEGHHEKWDGSGYPYGKTGTEIPLSARIVAVADVFDALTSKRPYKEPFSFEDSLGIIAEGRGKHFDPLLVDLVLEHKDEWFGLYRSFYSEHKGGVGVV